MLNGVSPYALLCASKPKPAPAVITPYDLYSMHQAAQAGGLQMNTASGCQAPSPAPLYASAAEKRTHYIADIHAKHGAAVRRTTFTDPPV